MFEKSSIRLKRLHGQLGEVAYELSRTHFSQFCPPDGWCPAINAYRCKDSIEVCVDLAGVDKKLIDLQVEPGRLVLRGKRPPPEPVEHHQQAVQILAMEIDCGSFERQILLPSNVDPARVTAEQRNGLLWIHLPLQPQA